MMELLTNIKKELLSKALDKKNLDYFYTYLPVTMITSIGMLIALAAV